MLDGAHCDSMAKERFSAPLLLLNFLVHLLSAPLIKLNTHQVKWGLINLMHLHCDSYHRHKLMIIIL